MTQPGSVPPLDPGRLRQVLGHYPTGVAVVTGIAPSGEPLALVVGTFSSVSLEPPLVSFLPMKSSATFEALRGCHSLCINILAADQEVVCRTIASRRADKLDGLAWSPSPSGDPVLDGALAWLDVRLEQTIEAGDHWIALCRVLALDVANPVTPLIFFQGGYGAFVVPSVIARIDADIESGVSRAIASRDDLEELAAEIGCECTLLEVVNPREIVPVAMAGHPYGWEPDLGTRLPLIAPIGDSIVASLPAPAQEEWLARAKGATEEQLAAFRERLDFCAREGYLVTYLADHEHDFSKLRRATTDYASSRLTPAEEGSIRARIIEATPVESYAVRELNPGTSYRVGSIIVPIPDADNAPALTLRLSSLPLPATGAQINAWVARAQAVAATIGVHAAA